MAAEPVKLYAASPPKLLPKIAHSSGNSPTDRADPIGAITFFLFLAIDAGLVRAGSVFQTCQALFGQAAPLSAQGDRMNRQSPRNLGSQLALTPKNAGPQGQTLVGLDVCPPRFQDAALFRRQIYSSSSHGES